MVGQNGDLLVQYIRVRIDSDVMTTVNTVQWDNAREFHFIFENYSIPIDAELRIYVKKPTGKEIYNPCRLENNEIIVQTTSQMLAEVGDNLSQLQIVTNKQKEIKTFPFIIHNSRSIISDSAIVSKDEFFVLDDLILQARNEIAKSKELYDLASKQEYSRVAEENIRKNNEVIRENAEKTRAKNTSDALNSVDVALYQTNKAKDDAISATSNTVIATDNANQATKHANEASVNANLKAQEAATATSNAKIATSDANKAKDLAKQAALGADLKANQAVVAATNADKAAMNANAETLKAKTATTNALLAIDNTNKATASANTAAEYANTNGLMASNETQKIATQFEDIKTYIDSTGNGIILNEIKSLLDDMYRIATESDVSNIINDTYVDEDDNGSIFEAGTNEDIDDILGDVFIENPESDIPADAEIQDIIDSLF